MGQTRYYNSKKSKIRHILLKYGGDAKYLASCKGKLRRTKEDAKLREIGLLNLKAYHCKYCGYWHIGKRNRLTK